MLFSLLPIQSRGSVLSKDRAPAVAESLEPGLDAEKAIRASREVARR